MTFGNGFYTGNNFMTRGIHESFFSFILFSGHMVGHSVVWWRISVT